MRAGRKEHKKLSTVRLQPLVKISLPPLSLRSFLTDIALATSVAAILLLLVTPATNYAISVDRSQEELRALPLASATPNAARLPKSDVNQQLDRVLTAPEYAWRNPSKAEAPPGWLEQFQDWLKDGMRSFSHALSRLGRAIARWLSSLQPQGPGLSLGGNSDGMISQDLRLRLLKRRCLLPPRTWRARKPPRISFLKTNGSG